MKETKERQYDFSFRSFSPRPTVYDNVCLIVRRRRREEEPKEKRVCVEKDVSSLHRVFFSLTRRIGTHEKNVHRKEETSLE